MILRENHPNLALLDALLNIQIPMMEGKGQSGGVESSSMKGENPTPSIRPNLSQMKVHDNYPNQAMLDAKLNRAVVQGQCQPCDIDISRPGKPAMEPPRTPSVMFAFNSFGFHPLPHPPLNHWYRPWDSERLAQVWLSRGLIREVEINFKTCIYMYARIT
ncbi:hypothetical protein DPMN_068387 [Dreissena polymorpha]|uniref:Uncharacterized protein n=1 Tax=Dreissena polymorpha TaxID=45954 RepID=A0A9D3Z2F7_DREPO|nr:hypothetical protein DPMN_068387 [Dreissena polymorpha]